MSVTADEWPKLRPQCFCLRARCSWRKGESRSGAQDHHHRDDSAAIDRGADRVPVLYAIQP
jgi:hypothetical protein